jgi:RHS repeat-associated protein
VATANGAGAVGTQYTYQPFGATTATGPASANSAQFTGRENDGTGLYYYRARYQHPTLQRFVSEDPLDFEAGDPNLHAYVFNAPTMYSDPTGEVVGAVVAAAAWAGASLAADWGSGRKLDWGAAAFAAVPIPSLGKARAIGKAAKAAAAAAKAAGGAKSAEKLAKHVADVSKARETLERLRQRLAREKGPKRTRPIEEAIRKVEDFITGHEKEMGQKWPEYRQRPR